MAYLPKVAQPRIPPLPNFTVLVDRDDGIEWVLSHRDDEGTLRVSLNTDALLRGSLPPRTDFINFGTEGAYMGQGIRLFVRGGRIGYEMVQYIAQSPPLNTRVGVVREPHLLVVPTGAEPWERFPDELGWILEDGLD